MTYTGPVVSQLSDVTYRIQEVARPRYRLIVHFNCLKKCLSHTPSTQSQVATDTDTTQPSSHMFGETLEVVEDSEPLALALPCATACATRTLSPLRYPLEIQDKSFKEGSNVTE